MYITENCKTVLWNGTEWCLFWGFAFLCVCVCVLWVAFMVMTATANANLKLMKKAAEEAQAQGFAPHFLLTFTWEREKVACVWELHISQVALYFSHSFDDYSLFTLLITPFGLQNIRKISLGLFFFFLEWCHVRLFFYMIFEGSSVRIFYIFVDYGGRSIIVV